MINKEFKVLLAPTYELAVPFEHKIEATVEAEYGSNVIHGTRITLAHHTDEYKHCGAPINTIVDDTVTEILVSHLDLDTIGGIMNITGNSIHDKEFAAAAEFVDVHGPHHLFKFPKQKAKIEAYWAWDRINNERINATEVIDVTDRVIASIEVIERIINNDNELLRQGAEWSQQSSGKVESYLISENNIVRTFHTNDAFCNAAYYSPNLNTIVPFIISYHNVFKSISVSCENAQAHNFNAKNFVQKLWGEKAGGHAGIAGSPRGEEMSLSDVFNAITQINKLYQ